MQKCGFDDIRPVLERASARETAARVALGAAARQFLGQAAGIEIVSHVVELGAAASTNETLPTPADVDALDADPVRCLDPEASARMQAEIQAAFSDGDTLGGVVEVVVHGLRLVSDHSRTGTAASTPLHRRGAHGIQAIKGVEFGAGFTLARTRGIPGPGRDHRRLRRTASNQRQVRRCRRRHDHRRDPAGPGGHETHLNRPRALRTVDVTTREPAAAINQRSDVCAVPAAGVVAEAMVALTVADLFLDKFGGDSVAESRRKSSRTYLENLVVR